MSERDENNFIKEYITCMKGPGVKLESVHIYNFGYQRNLPFPSVAFNISLKLNLQTLGQQLSSKWSLVIIGEKYVRRFLELMIIIDRVHEDTQALPFAIFVQTEDDNKIGNIFSPMTPTLV